MSGAPSVFLTARFRGQECPRHSYYFLGAIESLAALATRNLTTVLALI